MARSRVLRLYVNYEPRRIVQRRRNKRMHLLRGMIFVLLLLCITLCAVHVSSVCTECGG
jgi:hypothetical protein